MSIHAIKLLFRRWKLIVLVGILCAGLSALLSLLLPFEYRADAQVLIINQSRFGSDPYTAAKSAERIGENLAQIMESNDFFEKVLEQEYYNVNKAQFENISEQKKRKNWQRIVSPSVVFGTGLLNVSTYHTDPQEALDLAGATVNTLVTRGWEYVGGDVIVRVVNQPVVTRFPVRPNLIINVLVGFLVGIILMSVAVLKRSQRRISLHQW